MAVRKGLLAVVNNDPNFTNQSVENAVASWKIGWVQKTDELDIAIDNNEVLDDTQKSDLKDTINSVAYLNAGPYIRRLLNHTNSILDGSIIPPLAGVGTTINGQGTFLEILQLTSGLQSTIPELYGVSAAEKNRSVDDHLGILNGKFSKTTDSSQPVFTSMTEAITFINNAQLAEDTEYQAAIDDFRAFIDALPGPVFPADVTEQNNYNTKLTRLTNAITGFDTALQVHPYSVKRTQIINGREAINTQVTLENSNITTLRSYNESLAKNLQYISLINDATIRNLMIDLSSNTDWKSYFVDYDTNYENLNPIYDNAETLIDQIMASRGLPEVLDPVNLSEVVEKAKKDSRIDTKGFDRLFDDKIIEQCCLQLGLATYGSVYDQSERLLNNLNKRDRDLIAEEFDLNKDSNTIS